MLGITIENAASTARIFLIIAIVWFLMAFISRKRRIVSAVIYGVFGSLFAIYGIFAMVYAFIHMPTSGKIGLLFPIFLLIGIALILTVGITGLIKSKQDQIPISPQQKDLEEKIKSLEEAEAKLSDEEPDNPDFHGME